MRHSSKKFGQALLEDLLDLIGPYYVNQKIRVMPKYGYANCLKIWLIIKKLIRF